jgi:AcrR family transcriptional regulator
MWSPYNGDVPRARARSSVDRSAIVAAAADIVDREGWHALTLSDVARALGRHPSSMYAHVTSLDDLRHEIALLAVDELAEAVWRAALGKVGTEALSAIAQEYRQYAERYPGRTTSLSAVDVNEPTFAAKAARLHEPLAVTFASFGLSEEQGLVAHRVFGATVDGLVRTGASKDLHQAVDVFVKAIGTGEWPGPG